MFSKPKPLFVEYEDTEEKSAVEQLNAHTKQYDVEPEIVGYTVDEYNFTRVLVKWN